MVETPSTMLPLGTALPELSLVDAASGRSVSADDLADRSALLVMFICNHCPFVKHVVGEPGRLAEDYLPRGVGTVAINSNDVDAYPQDGPEHMRRLAEREGWEFPFSSTRRRRSRRGSGRRALPTSSSSMQTAAWPTGVSWTTAGREATDR